MKITIEETPNFLDLGGRLVRAWEGTTDTGIPCTLLVAAVGVEPTHPRAGEFMRELIEIESVAHPAKRVHPSAPFLN